MSNKIDEKKLREAKAKLACHIEPPKNSPYAQMMAQQAAENRPEVPSEGQSTGGASCSTGTGTVPVHDGKVRLTEMTTAGG